MSFQLTDLTPEDISDMVVIMSQALKKDELWQNLKGRATDETERQFQIDWIGPRLKLPDNFEGWKIVETSTGRMAAWALLAKPFSVSEDNKAVLESKPPQPPPGWNAAAAAQFEKVLLAVTKKHGYDPEQHYQRAITMVHPEFQRRGFGRWLSARCNESADRAGKITWCRARPGIAKLLLTMGYEMVEDVELDFRKFGGDATTHSYCLRRDPRPLEGAVETIRQLEDSL